MKKSISFLLVLSLVISLAFSSACGSLPGKATPGTEPSKAAATVEATVAPTAEQTEEAAASEEPTPAPAIVEPVVVKVFAKHNSLSDKYDTFPVIQLCETKANIKLQWEMVEENGFDEKKNLMLSSGDLPDLIMMGGLTDADILANIEAFLPMDSYLDSSPNIKKMFDLEPSIKVMSTAPDGHIYGLPHIMPLRPDTFDMAFLNQDWLDKLGLKMPETTDDFYNVLKQFKTKDPNGNGKADEIPFTMVSWGPSALFGLGSMMGSFGVVGNFSDDMVVIKDQKVEFWPTMDGYKEFIKYFNKLYKEGLLDNESFTQDWDKAQAKMRDPSAQRVGGSIQWTIQNVIGTEYEKSYAVLPPLKGPNGDQYWRSNTTATRAGKNYATITKNSKNPDAVMKFLNELYDEEISLQLFFGPIPKCIEKKDDGTYVILPPPDGMTAGEFQWKNAFSDQGPMFIGREFEKKIVSPLDYVKKMEAEKVYSQYYVKDIYPSIFWDKATQDQLSVLKTDVVKYVNDRYAYWIVNGGVDAEWDKYKSELDKMGLQELMKVYVDGYAKVK